MGSFKHLQTSREKKYTESLSTHLPSQTIINSRPALLHLFSYILSPPQDYFETIPTGQDPFPPQTFQYVSLKDSHLCKI